MKITHIIALLALTLGAVVLMSERPMIGEKEKLTCNDLKVEEVTCGGGRSTHCRVNLSNITNITTNFLTVKGDTITHCSSSLVGRPDFYRLKDNKI